GTVSHVKINGDPVYVFDQSKQPKCIGDNPGTAGGVKSGTVNGEIKPTSSSGHVKITGKKAVRDGDTCTLNKENCPGVYVSEPTPATPGSNSNPAVKAEIPKEKGYLEKAGDLLGKLDIKALKNMKVGINKGIDGVVEASGYNPAVMVIGAIAVAANEVFVPESVLDVTPGKIAGLGKKGLKSAKNIVKGEKAAKKAAGQGDGIHAKGKKKGTALPEGMKDTDNKSIREWYNKQTDPEKLKQLDKQWEQEGIPLEERSERIFKLRHDARLTAREYMNSADEVAALRNRDLAKYGSPDGPTFIQEVEKYTKQGLTDNKAYKSVINSASRTSSEYNDKFGITR
ncbi:MAG: DUF4150 domain-containing protein, partial [Phycisphaerae bacterium]|nr:DUF4150 domain-containing protein [Saprospiraceae bacterium]